MTILHMAHSPLQNASSLRRCFFALSVPSTVCQQAQDWLHCFPAPVRPNPIPSNNYHITLAFLGLIDDTQIQTLINTIDNWQAKAFELCLDKVALLGSGHYLTWQASQLADSHVALVQQLQELVKQVARPEQKAHKHDYLAHLTLHRNAALSTAVLDSLPPLIPVCWQSQRFALYQSQLSQPHATYSIIKDWPLLPTSNTSQ